MKYLAMVLAISQLGTMPAAYGQSPPVSAVVDGSVTNRVTGAGVPGASVTIFNREGTQYHAVTDNTGAFRVASADPGRYEALVAKDGFVLLPAGEIQITPGTRLSFALQFGNTQQARLTGRVLDSQDKPLANAQVDLIAGPDLRHTTTTTADGRFAFEKLPAGAYKLRASPPADHKGGEVATYFPGSIGEAGAQRLVVRGNSDVDGFRLQTAPVFRVRGVVLDETGSPSAQATVRIAPMTVIPAHVFLSFGTSFIAASEAPGAGPDEAHVVTGADGRFEFTSVRSGQWSISAEGAPRLDPQTGFNLAGSGALSLFLGDRDVQGSEIRMNPPFSLKGSAGWIVGQYHDASQRAIDGRPAPGHIAYPVWFRAADGTSSFLSVTVTQPDASFTLEPVREGRYLVQTLPLLADPEGTPGGHAQGGSPDASLNNRPVQHMPLDVGRSSEPIHFESGGWFDPDAKHVPLPFVTLGPSTLRGTVEHGAGAAVVLVSHLYTQSEIGQLAFCNPDGSFEVRGVRPGVYYIGAFQGLDLEGLRAPELLQRLISADNSIDIKAGATTTEIQFTALPWLD